MAGQKLASVDHQHIAQLCRDHGGRLQLFFRRRGCTPALAEDLTQEVFLRLTAYPRLGEIANPSAFLYRTATNLLRDTVKAARRRPTKPIDASERGANGPVDPLQPDRILEGRQDIALVSQAFAELTSRTQRMFVMNRIDNMRQCDIAAYFGLSVSLVEKSLRGAHGHLVDRYRRQRFRPAPTGSSRGATDCLLVGSLAAARSLR